MKPVLRPEPAAEVPGKGLDDVVVGLHFGKVGAVPEFFEPQEPFHAVQLPARFFGDGNNITNRRMGKVAVNLVGMNKSKRNVVEQLAFHRLLFGKHEGIEGMGGIGCLAAQPEKKRFGLGGIGS